MLPAGTPARSMQLAPDVEPLDGTPAVTLSAKAPMADPPLETVKASHTAPPQTPLALES